MPYRARLYVGFNAAEKARSDRIANIRINSMKRAIDIGNYSEAKRQKSVADKEMGTVE
jgi:hypothetical protein